jgi:hypothetical protein
MTSSIERAAASVHPPIRGAIYADDATTIDQYLDLDQAVTDPETGASTPRFLRGRYLTVQALVADVYLALQSNNTDTLDPTAAAGNFAPANCVVVPAGQSLTLLIPKTAATRYLAWRTASGSGSIRAWPSSPVGL